MANALSVSPMLLDSLRTVRRELVICLAALALLSAYVVRTSDQLPERVATHFDARGRADGWMTRGDHARFMVGFAASHQGFFARVFVLQPQFEVGSGLRCEMVFQRIAKLLHIVVNAVFDGCRAAHDIAVDVSASRQSTQIDVVDAFNRLTEISFENSVKLQGLSRGALERRVAEFVAQIKVLD